MKTFQIPELNIYEVALNEKTQNTLNFSSIF